MSYFRRAADLATVYGWEPDFCCDPYFGTEGWSKSNCAFFAVALVQMSVDQIIVVETYHNGADLKVAALLLGKVIQYLVNSFFAPLNGCWPGMNHPISGDNISWRPDQHFHNPEKRIESAGD